MYRMHTVYLIHSCEYFDWESINPVDSVMMYISDRRMTTNYGSEDYLLAVIY